MEKGTWKFIAVIFMVLFIAETSFILLGLLINLGDERIMNECYYEVCKDYPEALIEGRVCTCYDYDMLGDYVVAEQTWIR